MMINVHLKPLFFVLPFLFLQTTIAREFPEFPFPKDMVVVLAAKDIEYNGIPTQIYQFHTDDSIQEIIEFYEKEWDDLDEVDFGDLKILSHKDDEFLLTVQIERESGLQTHGTLSIAPMFEMLDGGGHKLRKKIKAVGANFPALSNTEIISDLVAEEIGGKSRSLLFSNEYSIERNIEFYRTKMMADGWKSVIVNNARSKRVKTTVLALNKNSKKLNIGFSRQEGKTYGVAVFLP